jgi:hypothetical protein
MAKHSTSQSGEQLTQQQQQGSVEEMKKGSEMTSLSSSYDFPFCCERSWVSHSFLLPPGEYLLFVATEEQKSSSTHPIPPASASAAHQHRHHQPQHHHHKPSSVPRNPATGTGRSASSHFRENQEIESGIWCHLTSTGCIGLHSQALEEEAKRAQAEADGDGEGGGIETKETEMIPAIIPPAGAAEGGGGGGTAMGTYFEEMKTKYSLPLPEVWPLMMDHQQEVSSKGLIRLLTQIRSEVNRVNIDFLEMKNKDSKNKLSRIPL